GAVIGAGPERQAISARLDAPPGRKQILHPAVGIGRAASNLGKVRLVLPPPQRDRNALRRAAERRIQNMRADGRAHETPPRSFSSRSRVILDCSAAAIRSS